MNILHITPHIGGGVGKVLTELVKNSNHVNHTIVSLEKNIKHEVGKNSKIIECPTIEELENLIKKSDILQLEYWNHPSLRILNEISNIPIRLVVWFHNNGLFQSNIKCPGKLPPLLPISLIEKSHIFLFTNECSFEIPDISKISSSKLGCVYSSGGFSDFPYQYHENNSRQISVGYFGSTNFSKLHPDFAMYLNQVKLNSFRFKMIGEIDDTTKNILLNKVNPEIKVEFTGYISEHQELIAQLFRINVLAYILNPEHYGTTENSLLEAMSMGITPIVLNNPTEKCLIENNKTGFIVSSPKEFGEVITYLNNNPDEIRKIGTNAANYVRERFSIENTEKQLNYFYERLLKMNKTNIDFDFK